jgi:hypothetical protein
MRMTFQAVLLTLVAGCSSNSPKYFAPPKPLTSGEMMPAMMPAVMGGMTGGMMASPSVATIELPFRRPTAAESMALQAQSKQLGFQVPFLQREDIDVSIQYTITNLSTEPGQASVAVDGANEYTSYDVSAIQAYVGTLMLPPDADAPTVLPLFQTTRAIVPAKGTLSGNIREDDLAEIDRDLDAIGRFKGPYLTVLLNDSTATPLGMEMVPKTVKLPQLWKLIVTFKSTVPMRLDFLVRVRDQADVLAEGKDPLYKPNPKAFTPMIAGAVPIVPPMP